MSIYFVLYLTLYRFWAENEQYFHEMTWIKKKKKNPQINLKLFMYFFIVILESTKNL